MCRCFGAGTLVETAEGPRAIETVRIGDLVLSRDEATGETGYQPVTEVFITPDKEVLELTLTDDDGGSETLLTTPGHPFWVEGQGWVIAAELRVGEALMTAEQGLATLSAALSREGRRTVYNLEVEGWHTYFVGEAGAWVHNACRCGGDSGAAAERAKNIAKGIPESALGPSGKPKVHNVAHSSRKRALDAAREEGKGPPMHHTATDTQSPHFHPVDGAGEKIPGVHHNYSE